MAIKWVTSVHKNNLIHKHANLIHKHANLIHKHANLKRKHANAQEQQLWAAVKWYHWNFEQSALCCTACV